MIDKREIYRLRNIIIDSDEGAETKLRAVLVMDFLAKLLCSPPDELDIALEAAHLAQRLGVDEAFAVIAGIVRDRLDEKAEEIDPNETITLE